MSGSARGSAPGAQFVREMFGRIAPRYDFLNHLLSFNVDKSWRRLVAQRFLAVLTRPDACVLDLCCGTGDLSVELQAGGARCVVGADFCHPMLVRAREKTKAALPIVLVEADALQMPFADGTFDLVTAAFGFRNLANYEAGLREIRRVLKPGGQLGILEFAEPDGRVFGPLYGFYFRKILPRVGALVSGDSNAYRYLGASVADFPSAGRLYELMATTGFTSVEQQRLTGGIAYLHSARRSN